MILSEKGAVKILGEVNEISAELELLLFSLKNEIGEKQFEKLIKDVLKHVNENRIEKLINKEKDKNKILCALNETLEEIIKTLK